MCVQALVALTRAKVVQAVSNVSNQSGTKIVFLLYINR